MACGFYRIRGLGAVHVNFNRGRAPARCVHCGGISSVLCDHEVSDKAAGWKSSTCDAPPCANCALHVPGKNGDYCRRHARSHRFEVPTRLPFEAT
jgi:hypothetical protein